MRFQSRIELLRKIQQATRHPARRLHRLRGHVMIRIFLVVAPRIVTENRIHLEQAKQEDQPAAKLGSRYVVEAMIAISQIVGFLEAESLDQPRRVPLIGKHRLPQGQVVRVLFVVAGPNKVTGVALAQQLR